MKHILPSTQKNSTVNESLLAAVRLLDYSTNLKPIVEAKGFCFTFLLAKKINLCYMKDYV